MTTSIPSPTRSPADAEEQVTRAVDHSIEHAADKRELRSVLLATDGLGSSHSPAHLARLLAAHIGAPLQVVTAIEPVLVYAGSSGLAPVPMLLDESIGSARESALTGFLADAWPHGTAYQLDVRFGPVAYAIAGCAREVNAQFVVVGAAPHRRRRGVLSGVMAAQVLRQVRSPVLSVAPGLDHLPRSIVIATDFGAPSLRASREALRLLEPGGRVTLATVTTMTRLDSLIPQDEAATRARSERMLATLEEHLGPWLPKGAVVEHRVLSGITSDQIISLAEELDADLIAIGTHGPNFVERFFVGSVATNVLHGAPCSVLAAPPPRVAEQVALELDAWGTAESRDAEAWPALVDGFTRRNLDRRVRVEVDDPAIGAQIQATGYVLQGVTYDPNDRRIELMLAARRGSKTHLTRMISHVESVGVTRSPRDPKNGDRDSALHVRAEGGDTLLLFED